MVQTSGAFVLIYVLGKEEHAYFRLILSSSMPLAYKLGGAVVKMHLYRSSEMWYTP